ncbi:MAG: hypothetical protein ACI81R_000674 [Bradymonadia bacterium]|jgi:hypothetical protein
MSLASMQASMQAALLDKDPVVALHRVHGVLASEQARGLDVHRRNVVFGFALAVERKHPDLVKMLGFENVRFFAREALIESGREGAPGVIPCFYAFLLGRHELLPAVKAAIETARNTPSAESS